jgi:hypothetical protein
MIEAMIVFEFSGGFSMSYLAKFWCSKTFPAALATACPPRRIRKYMQRSLDHVRALLELGRNGDFSKVTGMRMQYKSHRRSELIRMGLASEVQVRKRCAWGKIEHARLVEAASGPSAAAGAAEANLDDDDSSDDEEAVLSNRALTEAVVEVAAVLAEQAAELVDEGAPPSLKPRQRRHAGFYATLPTDGTAEIPES